MTKTEQWREKYKREHGPFVPYGKLSPEEQKKYDEKYGDIPELDEIETSKDFFKSRWYRNIITGGNGAPCDKKQLCLDHKNTLCENGLWNDEYEKLFEESKKWW